MFGFVRIASAVPKLEVSSPSFNASEIVKLIKEASEKKIDVLTFPELCISGATCKDLFFQTSLISESESALKKILQETKAKEVFVLVGMPVKFKNKLFNCGVCIYKGKVLGVVPKTYLDNEEKRWFSTYFDFCSEEITLAEQKAIFGTNNIFSCSNNNFLKIGVEIGKESQKPNSKSIGLSLSGASVILNPSAIPEVLNVSFKNEETIKNNSQRLKVVYCFSNSGMFESSTDNSFSGHSFIYEDGKKVAESKIYSVDSEIIYADVDVEAVSIDKIKSEFEMEDEYNNIYFETSEKSRDLEKVINQTPFEYEDMEKESQYEIAFNTQVSGLIKRVNTVRSKKALLGVSGGLDSTLALLVTVKAFDVLGKSRKDIIGITLPGFGTTDRTYDNALLLMKALKIEMREIPIKNACLQHFEDIGHDPKILDSTYENAQARERTQILMDIANKENGLVVGTGDLSEIALGWATYNGDHMSMYAVNAGVPKTMVRALTLWVSKNIDVETEKILLDILNTPVSPELLPPSKDGKIKQKTEDIIGPYELHDFFLYYVYKFGFSPKKIIYLAENAFKNKYSKEEIITWLKTFYRRFATQQFKRSCMPDGPQIYEVSLSPRCALKMPSDSTFEFWTKELD